jgi:hypothetical protein
MIIEAAVNLAPLVLTQKESYQGIREEDFSNLLSDCCRMALSGVDLPRGMVNVEVYYHNSALRCDLVIDDTKLPFQDVNLSHKEYVECKYFRETVGNPLSNCEGLWRDFRKVLKSASFAYSVVLCEDNYLPQFETGNHDHDICVDRCFNLKNPSYFKLWEPGNFAVNSKIPFSTVRGKLTKVLQVKRYTTEAFPIRFENDMRIYRIYLFYLYVEGKTCRQYEF